MKSVIVIPARYASTRFPGKPLHFINGVSMLERTVGAARKAGQATGARTLCRTPSRPD
jgi:3-deoxy-manno-octulosonate cytidylyltransferase (CMP-KDO synthetase)